jgi:demethylmenaquinone methyltransferase / 2-methoxy-6-polyprenyl-1,4-benzoquinol methylase
MGPALRLLLAADEPSLRFLTAVEIMAVDKSTTRVRRMFAAIAPRYDRLNHVLSLQIDRYWRWRTVRIAGRGLDGPVLDVCTGTGDLALAFQRRRRGTAPIVGADFCRPMLEIGIQKRDRKRITSEQLSFVEADAQQLPFADASFAIVSVAFGLRNVADTDRGLREMSRVCRPGGRVAVLEFSTPTFRPFAYLYGWYFRNVLPRIGHWMARNDERAYDYLPQSVGEFPSGAALVERLNAAGLENTCYYPLTFGVATLYIGQKPLEAGA